MADYADYTYRACPTCHAEPGDLCVSRTGKYTREHSARTRRPTGTTERLERMGDAEVRTRAIEIAEKIERLASQAAPLTEQEHIRLLCYIETDDHLAEIDEADRLIRSKW